MASLLIRDVDDKVKTELEKLAKLNRRSTNAQVKFMLEKMIGETKKPNWVQKWITDAESLDIDFRLPVRSLPRDLEVINDYN